MKELYLAGGMANNAMEDHASPSKAPPSEFLGLTETASLIRGDYHYY